MPMKPRSTPSPNRQPRPLRQGARRSRQLVLLMLATFALLTGCASGPGPVERPALPVAPADFGLAVQAPRARAGDNAKAFAARTAGALTQANRRLSDDAAFYDDVRAKFSK